MNKPRWTTAWGHMPWRAYHEPVVCVRRNGTVSAPFWAEKEEPWLLKFGGYDIIAYRIVEE